MTRTASLPFDQIPGGSGTAVSAILIAAAVAAGRLPGEPAMILPKPTGPSLLAWLIGARRRGPLADPRLEVLRAISASLANGVAQIAGELLAAAHRVGWTADDLRRTFPGVVVGHSQP